MEMYVPLIVHGFLRSEVTYVQLQWNTGSVTLVGVYNCWKFSVLARSSIVIFRLEVSSKVPMSRLRSILFGLLGLLVSCCGYLRQFSLFLGIANVRHHYDALGNDTVQSISSIEVLRDAKKVISSEIRLAMKQCETAILKSKNDEMLKGPSFCLGLLKQSIGDIEGALVDYERAALRFPKNGAASFNAAGILENMGRDMDAAVKYKSSMLVNETCEASLSKLIPLLLRNDREIEAKSICSRMCKQNPSIVSYTAFEQLGSTYHKMGSLDQALMAYESALKISGDPLYSSDTSPRRLVEALNNAALAASALKSVESRHVAEGYYLRSLDVAPDNANTHTHYGVFLKQEKRNIEAAEEFRKAIELDPEEKFKETGYAAVQLASVTGGSAATKMNHKYIRGLFDGYADRFDSELLDKLDYRGHHQVVDALYSARKGYNNHEVPDHTGGKLISETDTDTVHNVIDIGSGTGLCGELIRRKFSKAHITGVDLSQRMLEKSIERMCYNRLVLGDAVSYLNRTAPNSVDSIVAADVFIYIGDLTDVFHASFKVLGDNNSFLVFTVEELMNDLVVEDLLSLDSDRDGSVEKKSSLAGVRLLSSGRFGHSEGYIRRVAGEAGFDVYDARRGVLRLQSDSPVRSITFVLMKTL